MTNPVVAKRATAMLTPTTARGLLHALTFDFFECWFAYAKYTNTYKLKKLAEEIERSFPNGISTKETNRLNKQI